MLLNEDENVCQFVTKLPRAFTDIRDIVCYTATVLNVFVLGFFNCQNAVGVCLPQTRFDFLWSCCIAGKIDSHCRRSTI